MQVVLFKLQNEVFGFNIKDVQEIVRLQEKTKMPNMPGFIEGVINLRGKVIPVLNLAKKLNLKANEESDITRLIVVNLSEDKQLAIKADEVTEVIYINEDDIELPPKVTQDSNHCLRGVAKLKDKLILLIKTDNIMDAEYLPVLENNIVIS